MASLRSGALWNPVNENFFDEFVCTNRNNELFNKVCSIRTATNEDIESIYKVNNDSVRELCSSCYNEEDIIPWIARLHPSMYKPFIDNGTMKVVALESEVVACGRLEPFSDTTATVCCLYVSPSMSRKGIGRLLLQFLEKEAKVKGYKSEITQYTPH
ncbi:uncharacterized protein [Dysidea avara]|uniref:uncharacterized protein n=1 Tax=Dysidea avara TaxID=196820 RepID=UPI00332BF914